jgi:hypothetical protein
MKSIDPKTLKKIDSLVSNSKSMIAICIVGIFIPIILLIGTVLGIYCWFSRKELLKDINLSELESPEIKEKITIIEKASLAYLSPLIILITYITIVTCMIFFSVSFN